MALFSEGKYAEVAALAQKMTLRFPMHGFGWMMLGISLGQMGRSEDGLAILKKAAALSPGDAGVHINLGKALSDSGRLDEAIVSYRRALKIKPDIAEAHSNLGSILQVLGRSDEAEASLQRALQLKPNLFDAHFNLGNTFREQGRLEEAEASYLKALKIKPDFAKLYNNLGVTLLGMNRLEEAENCCRKALLLSPNYANAYGNLGAVLSRLGKTEEALENYRQQIRLEPENGNAIHQIAALSGTTTDRAPDQYVKELFNGYADRFDDHLQQILKYETPKKLVELITQHVTPPEEKWRVLDLGCGTGLVGSAIEPFSSKLVGIDLSSKMLEKASSLNLYSRLECSDLLTTLRLEKESSYDVITSADVFIYVGKLDEIVSEVKRLLCPGGYFLFSVEDPDVSSSRDVSQDVQSEYQLMSTGRYSHSNGYLSKLAAANGFLPIVSEATEIRMDRGQPLMGHLLLWKIE